MGQGWWVEGEVNAKRFDFAAQPDADDAKIGSDAEPHRDI